MRRFRAREDQRVRAFGHGDHRECGGHARRVKRVARLRGRARRRRRAAAPMVGVATVQERERGRLAAEEELTGRHTVAVGRFSSGRRRRIRRRWSPEQNGETAGLRAMSRLPVQFLRRSDVIDDGEASGQDGGAGRAHWPRELTAMASVLRGFLAPSENGAEERGGGERRVQGGRCVGSYPSPGSLARWGWRGGRQLAAQPLSTATVAGAGGGGDGWRWSWAGGQGRLGGLRPGAAVSGFSFNAIIQCTHSTKTLLGHSFGFAKMCNQF